MNEIMLFNANRPVRSVHNSEGWTLEAIAEHAVPSMKPFFTDLKRSPEYFHLGPDLRDSTLPGLEKAIGSFSRHSLRIRMCRRTAQNGTELR